jgi:hypothetical protein
MRAGVPGRFPCPVVVLVLWLLGFGFRVGGGLFHLLLVIAVIVLVFNLIGGRRSVA